MIGDAGFFISINYNNTHTITHNYTNTQLHTTKNVAIKKLVAIIGGIGYSDAHCQSQFGRRGLGRESF